MTRQRTLLIATPDGTADAQLFPASGGAVGAKRGILLLPDIVGVRASFVAIAERLVGMGYTVLLPNVHYRAGPWPLFDHEPRWSDPDDNRRVRALNAPLDAAAMQRDGMAFALELVRETGAPIGILAYSTRGRMALAIAAAIPDKVAAVGAFHPGRLVLDAADSPHRLLARIAAPLCFVFAKDDTSMPGDTKAIFAAELAATGHADESVIIQASHGFAIPDHPNFDGDAVNAGWARMIRFFGAMNGAATLRGTSAAAY